MSDSPDFAALYAEHGNGQNPVAHLLREYVLRYPVLVAAAVVINITFSAVRLFPPYLLGVATDLVASGPDSFSLLLVPKAWLPQTLNEQFLLTAGLLGATAVLNSTLHLLNYYVLTALRVHLKHDLRTDAYAASQELGMDFFATAETGDVMSVLNDDIDQFGYLFGGFLDGLAWFIVYVGGVAVLMIALHWQLALILLVVLSPVIVTTRVFYEKIGPLQADVRSMVGTLNARIENSISGIATVKAAGNERYESERVRDTSEKHRDIVWAVSKTQALFMPVTRLFANFATVVVFGVGGYWAVFGPPADFLAPLTVGTFVAFFFYAREFTRHAGGASRYVYGYSNIEAAAERILGLMYQPPTVPEADETRTPEEIDGRVRYEDVSFSYPGTSEASISNVSFDVEPGAFVGVVGPSGAGKSTLLKLLIRFYDPDDGRVLVDGYDIRTLAVSSLRQQVGYVSQEPFLFDDTVRENVAYADPEASDEAVVEAAKRANAHEFIVDLPEEYGTRVGERGVKLSGGQRQRIAIARALLKDPAILVLDEATSHVDNRTELLIQDALETLIADRTTFAIAHSLATVRNADQTLVLDGGELVETGTHEALLDEDGLYAELWRVHVGESDGPSELLEEGE